MEALSAFVLLTSFKPTYCGSNYALPKKPLLALRPQLGKTCLESVALSNISAACLPPVLNTAIAEWWTVSNPLTPHPLPVPIHILLPGAEPPTVPSALSPLLSPPPL